jgi:hypothetical protein
VAVGPFGRGLQGSAADHGPPAGEALRWHILHSFVGTTMLATCSTRAGAAITMRSTGMTIHVRPFSATYHRMAPPAHNHFQRILATSATGPRCGAFSWRTVWKHCCVVVDGENTMTAHGTEYARAWMRRFWTARAMGACLMVSATLASCGGEGFSASTDLADSGTDAGGSAGSAGTGGAAGVAGEGGSARSCVWRSDQAAQVRGVPLTCWRT